jgi:predicted DNA-binding transcriptional regulator AlpA
VPSVAALAERQMSSATLGRHLLARMSPRAVPFRLKPVWGATGAAREKPRTVGAAMQRDELLTVDQVLEELAVARRTFARWRSLGRAPQCIKLPNGELRIWRSELLSWLRSRTEHVV